MRGSATEEVLRLVQPRPGSTVSAWPPIVSHLPVAPGLFTYRFPVDVFASGAHRFSGVALTVGFAGVVLGSALAYPRAGKDGLVRAVDALGRAPKPLLWASKWCVGFPLVYHLFSGVRHVGWQWGLLSLEPSATSRGSAAILTTVGAASVVLSFLRFKPAKSK